MNNKKIEKKAINALEQRINSVECLDPYFNSDDKEPTWDGYIGIYSNKEFRKEDFKRVPVQIKGTKQNDLSKSEIHFNVSVVDLKNYLREGGVLYFVIFVDSDKSKIYYNELLVVKIRHFLYNKEHQKTISIPFIEFPENPLIIKQIIINFEKHKHLQTSFSDKELKSIEDIVNKSTIDSIKIDYYPPILDSDLKARNDYGYIYYKEKNSDIYIPVEELLFDVKKSETKYEIVSIGDEEYYDSYIISSSSKSIEINFGHSFKMILIPIKLNSYMVSFELKLTKNLQYIIKDIEFILDFNKLGNIHIKDKNFNFRIGLFDDEIEILTNLKMYYNQILRIFEFLKLDTNYILPDINKEDIIGTKLLSKGLIRKESVVLKSSNFEGLRPVIYCGKKLLLYFNKAQLENEYYIQDINYEMLSKVILKYDKILLIENINYNLLMEEYRKTNNQEIYYNIYYLIDQLLLGYDYSNDTRKDLLEKSNEFSNLLIELNPNVLDDINIYLYIYQIKKRMNTLKDKDKEEIINYLNESDYDSSYKTILSSLLDYKELTNHYFKLLSDEMKQQLLNSSYGRFIKNYI